MVFFFWLISSCACLAVRGWLVSPQQHSLRPRLVSRRSESIESDLENWLPKEEKPKPRRSGDKFSGKGAKRTRFENYAVVSSWRRPEKRVIEYEIDRKVWIRRLPKGADAAYLRDVMSDAFGPVTYTEVAPDDTAYVVFERPQDALDAARTSVVIRSGDELTDMTIDSELFISRIPQIQAGTRRVFVGNIPYEGVTNDLLDKVFIDGGCSRPLSKRRPYPGIAYLEFPSEEDTKRAVALAGTRLLGRALRVDYDNKRRVKADTEPKQDQIPPTELPKQIPTENKAQAKPPLPSVPKLAVKEEKISTPPATKTKPLPEKIPSTAVKIPSRPSPTTPTNTERNTTTTPEPLRQEKTKPTQTEESTSSSLAAVRAAAVSAAAAWRQAEALRSRVSFLESRVPRRATWQPSPFAIRLGADARPRDILRLRVDRRELELVVPETAGPGSLLVVRGALECIVPRGAIPGEALAVPLPGKNNDDSRVIVVPPGRRPGSRLYLAYPVDDLTPAANALPPPARLPELLPPPPSPQLPPGKSDTSLHPHQDTSALALRAAPNSELAVLRSENARLKRELASMRQTLSTLTELQAKEQSERKEQQQSASTTMKKSAADEETKMPPSPPSTKKEAAAAATSG